MRILFGSLLGLGLAASAGAGDWPESGAGAMEITYHPVHCIRPPCPDWKVEKFELKTAEGVQKFDVHSKEILGFISNFNATQSAMTNFRGVRVKGSWKLTDDGLEMNVTEWEARIKEKVPSKPKPSAAAVITPSTVPSTAPSNGNK